MPHSSPISTLCRPVHLSIFFSVLLTDICIDLHAYKLDVSYLIICYAHTTSVKRPGLGLPYLTHILRLASFFSISLASLEVYRKTLVKASRA